MAHVFVTGANGFVAAHVVKFLVERKYQVTGSVRSQSKIEQILKHEPHYKGKVDFVVIPDMSIGDAWDEVFQKHAFDYVIHVAAPVPDGEGNLDFDRDFLDPAVKGCIGLLEAARKYGKQVKHITITGTFGSIAMPASPEVVAARGRPYSAEDWAPWTADEARRAQDPAVSYRVAKLLAEKATWEFVEKFKPAYSVSVLLATLIIGPAIQPVTSMAKLNLTSSIIYSLINGTYKVTPPTWFTRYIDVRDLAEAHIKALKSPGAANQRLIVGTGKFSNEQLVRVIKDRIPSLKDRLPTNEIDGDGGVQFDIDDSKTRTALGIEFRSFEETAVDAVKRFLQLEDELNGH